MRSMRSTVQHIALSAILACSWVTMVNANDGVVSDAIIHRAGLQVEWNTHSGVGIRDRVVDWHLDVNENKPTTYFTIRAGQYREKFSQNKISPFGKPYGIDGAIEYASVRKEVLTAELENDGVKDPKILVDQYTLPESTIYLLTSSGDVKAIDADSGETKWHNQVGDPRLPSIGVSSASWMADEVVEDNDFGLSDSVGKKTMLVHVTRVAVINGSTLYCLDGETGKKLWSQKCRYAVGAPPKISDKNVYVPLVNGRLEIFNLEKDGLQSKAFVAVGEGVSRPVLTEKTISWSTGNGHMNVAPRFGGKMVSYQLRADGGISNSAAYDSGMFYVTSLDGFVYAVDEDRGSVTWQVSTGAANTEAAVPLGTSVFVINDNYELFKLSAASGVFENGWETPKQNVAKFLGASKNHLFVLDKVGNLNVLSQESGAVLSSVPFGSVDKVLLNLQNDRLYVTSVGGMVQCMREESSPIPHFHANEFGVVQVDPTDLNGQQSAKAKGGGMAGDLEDPFKQADDPFKSSPADAAGGGDPFATKPMEDDGDPFSGGAKKEGVADDPFSGGTKKPAEDPFGGSGVEDDPFK